MDKIILIGGGGHCKACIDVIEEDGRFQIVGIVDVKDKVGQKVLNYEIIATDDNLPRLAKEFKNFFITFGQIKSPNLRIEKYSLLKQLKVNLPPIISPFAYISKNANIEEGTIIMHKAFVNAGAKIGKNCIINTGAIIEHDVIIEDNCHISTGAIINGGTVVRRNSFVGSNAMAKEYIEVGEDCIISGGGGGDEELTKRDSSKGKDLKIAKEHWEKQETVSLKDRNLRELERFSIINQLKKIKPTTLADIGCGDCSDTIYYSDYVENIFAFDYSETMLRKAAKIVSNKRIKLSKFDILKEAINIKVDIITTKRCLINLGTFENQKDAIRKIHDSLNKDGYYLMLECSLDGLNNLNILRQKVALNPIPEPFHNLYFELNDLMSFIQDFFDIETIENFSTYYFLTRIYNQILDSTEYLRFDNFARRIHSCIDIFGSSIIGPQFLMVCKKK